MRLLKHRRKLIQSLNTDRYELPDTSRPWVWLLVVFGGLVIVLVVVAVIVIISSGGRAP